MTIKRRLAIVSSLGKVENHADLDPMLEEGAKNSTGGISDADRLCDSLSMPLKLRGTRERYKPD